MGLCFGFDLGLGLSFVFGFYFGTVESRKYVDLGLGLGEWVQVGLDLAKVKD